MASCLDYVNMSNPFPTSNPAVEPEIVETDEEIIERLRMRFNILEDMIKAVKASQVRALMVVSPPGVGKTYTVEKVLKRYDTLANVADDQKLKKYEIIKGNISALGLYCKLWEFQDTKNVIVLDDADHLLFDDLGLNLLKAALDTNKTRTISWYTDSKVLRSEDIPSSFEFNGGMVFITNLKFENVRSKNLRAHLEALESRCHHIDLTINTEREKMLRIKQITIDGMLNEYRFSSDLVQDIVDFIDANKRRMRELSLRTVVKCADLAKSFPDRWKSMAEVTLMR